MTKWLLERDADVAVKNFQEKTALQVASESGFDEIAEVLRQHGVTD